jgi:guanylate kinase
MEKSQLVLFIGPTCVGKTTLIGALRERYFPDSGLIVSFTTRPPRTEMGETNGVGYFFVTEEEFLRMEANGEFYESVKRPTGYYASSQKQVHELLTAYPIVFGDLDIEGAKVVREREPDALLVFLYPDNMADLGVRLRARPHREPEAKILARLKVAEEEMTHADDFDVKLCNKDGKFEDTVQAMLNILRERGVVPPEAA